MHHEQGQPIEPLTVIVHTARVALTGDLTVPATPTGIVVFANGSSAGRLSPRNREPAEALVSAGFATLLLDLLTREEEAAERYTRHVRFDIPLLVDRLVGTIGWVTRLPRLARLPVGLFGASTGAAAALVASTRAANVRAIVARGGRPDLVEESLQLVRCPTLLIVGALDTEVIELNHRAIRRMRAPTQLHIVPDAGHLFEEPGALREVTDVASAWFQRHLGPRVRDEVHATR